ncbi:frizzled-4-like [Lutzomyia longipalpis]|uniref:Frizzled-4 n=1 Tax=Lutzomyia longipalpis TaxID=7200 RepID=A0A7G3ATW0_LUTLO|nr:frizzled-4-like [Lutzomyia longipalpis]
MVTHSTRMLMRSCLLVLLISLACAAHANPDISMRTCEPIRIELCRGIGYNETSMPNLVGHEVQTDVDFTLQTFSPLIQYGCSAQLHFFLCAAYVPMCTPKVPVPIGPCRGLCETTRARCLPVLQGFGFPWPSALECSRFPEENNHEHMCMEGPGEPSDGLPPPTSKIKSHVSNCQDLVKSHLYARLNRSGRCAPLCEADIMFDAQEKHLAEVWVTAWSVAALLTAIVATLCLIFTDTKWDKIFMPLVTCHLLVAVGWSVRWLAKRNPTACGYDPQLPGVSLLLTDGLSNAPCAGTFLLRYYFGMAAGVWWAILCFYWHLAVRRTRMENLTERPGQLKFRTDSYSSLTQLTAWGVPALQTVAVLVSRYVDADELLGACYVGNQSDRALRLLVAMPLFCCWCSGSVNLFVGYLMRRRKPEIPPLRPMPEHMDGMGRFLFVYCIPSGLLMIAVFYEFANRDLWLNVQPSMEPAAAIKAPMWPFMMKAFMELLLGVLASAWALGPRAVTMWKNRFGKKCKQTPQKFPAAQPIYPAASYQIVCPQNSMVSSMTGSLPRHPRKYPSHALRKHQRMYKTSVSQTRSLTGNETVF